MPPPVSNTVVGLYGFTLVLARRIARRAADPRTNGSRKQAAPTSNVMTRGKKITGKARLSSTPTSSTATKMTGAGAAREASCA